MKKLISILIFAALLVSLASCGPKQPLASESISFPPQALRSEKWPSSSNAAFSEAQPEDSKGLDIPGKMQAGKISGKDVFSFLYITLGAEWLSDEIVDAKLFLKPIGDTVPDKLSLYLLTGVWDDYFMSRLEARAIINGDSVIFPAVTQEPEGWISVPVTGFIKTWLGGGVQNNGIAIFSDKSDELFTFASSTAEDEDAPYILTTGAAGNRALTYGRFPYTEMAQTDSIIGNCMSFALRDTDMIFSGDLLADQTEMKRRYASGGIDELMDYFAALAEDYVEKNKYGLQISSFRHIDSFDSNIDPLVEYRIAMRIGVNLINDNIDFSDPHSFDYHFRAQINDGRWAQKFPVDSSQIVACSGPGISPGNYPWDSAYQRTIKSRDYYTSKIVYFAVTKTVDGFTSHKS